MIETTPLLYEHGLILALASAGITAFTTVVRYFTIDKEKVAEAKKNMEHHKELMKSAQKDKDYKAVQKHQGKMLEATQEQAKAGLKPMLFTFVPIILIFGFLRGTYGDIGSMRDVMLAEILPNGTSDVHIAEIHSTWLNSTDSYDAKSNQARLQITHLTQDWYWGRLGHHSGGTINVSFVHEGEIDFYKQPDTLITYTKSDGVTETHKISGTESQDGSLIKISKSAYTPLEGNKVAYTIDYENTDIYWLMKVAGIRFGWFGFYFLCSFPISM